MDRNAGVLESEAFSREHSEAVVIAPGSAERADAGLDLRNLADQRVMTIDRSHCRDYKGRCPPGTAALHDDEWVLKRTDSPKAILAAPSHGGMSDQIPSQVETFVRDGIGSIAELELLLLLAEDPAKSWTTDAAARQLYVTPASVETVFVQMTSRGLLSHGPEGYRFNPRTPEVVDTVKALRDLYATRRLKVMEMIYAGPTEKYQSFADAFRLRKNQ